MDVQPSSTDRSPIPAADPASLDAASLPAARLIEKAVSHDEYKARQNDGRFPQSGYPYLLPGECFEGTLTGSFDGKGRAYMRVLGGELCFEIDEPPAAATKEILAFPFQARLKVVASSTVERDGVDIPYAGSYHAEIVELRPANLPVNPTAEQIKGMQVWDCAILEGTVSHVPDYENHNDKSELMLRTDDGREISLGARGSIHFSGGVYENVWGLSAVEGDMVKLQAVVSTKGGSAFDRTPPEKVLVSGSDGARHLIAPSPERQAVYTTLREKIAGSLVEVAEAIAEGRFADARKIGSDIRAERVIRGELVKLEALWSAAPEGERPLGLSVEGYFSTNLANSRVASSSKELGIRPDAYSRSELEEIALKIARGEQAAPGGSSRGIDKIVMLTEDLGFPKSHGIMLAKECIAARLPKVLATEKEEFDDTWELQCSYQILAYSRDPSATQALYDTLGTLAAEKAYVTRGDAGPFRRGAIETMWRLSTAIAQTCSECPAGVIVENAGLVETLWKDLLKSNATSKSLRDSMEKLYEHSQAVMKGYLLAKAGG